MIVHVQVIRPEPWLTVRRVVHVSPSRCKRPVRVRAGHRIAEIPCGRRLPEHAKCPGCRMRIIIEPAADGAVA